MMRFLSLVIRMTLHFWVMIGALKIWEFLFSQPTHVERLIILGVVGTPTFLIIYRPWLWPRDVTNQNEDSA